MICPGCRTPALIMVVVLAAFFPAVAVRAADVPPVSELPDIHDYKQYRVDPYIRAAVALQSLDRAAALEKLHEMARYADGQVMVICRMLFAARTGTEFRRPMIGGAVFIRGTYSDWPLEPIEIVDGVPFLIVTGYVFAGLPESDEQYLRYVETHADWSTTRYALKTPEEKGKALGKLLASPKWTSPPLSASERELLMQFLGQQVQ